MLPALSPASASSAGRTRQKTNLSLLLLYKRLYKSWHTRPHDLLHSCITITPRKKHIAPLDGGYNLGVGEAGFRDPYKLGVAEHLGHAEDVFFFGVIEICAPVSFFVTVVSYIYYQTINRLQRCHSFLQFLLEALNGTLTFIGEHTVLVLFDLRMNFGGADRGNDEENDET